MSDTFNAIVATEVVGAQLQQLTLADLPKEKINRISRVESMSNLPELADQIVSGQVGGRVVIDVNA